MTINPIPTNIPAHSSGRHPNTPPRKLIPATVKVVLNSIKKGFASTKELSDYLDRWTNVEVPTERINEWNTTFTEARSHIMGKEFLEIYANIFKELNSTPNENTGKKIERAKELLTELPDLAKKYESGLNEFERRFKAQIT